jgi:hypothetical protein
VPDGAHDGRHRSREVRPRRPRHPRRPVARRNAEGRRRHPPGSAGGRPARAPGCWYHTAMQRAARGGSTARIFSATSSIIWCSTRATGAPCWPRPKPVISGRPCSARPTSGSLAGSRPAGLRPGRQRPRRPRRRPHLLADARPCRRTGRLVRRHLAAGPVPQRGWRRHWAPLLVVNDDPQYRPWFGTVQDGTPDGPKLHSIIVDPRDSNASLLRDVGRRRA